MLRLVISDLHLTDDPKDAYRWDIEQWIYEKIEELPITHIYILGDLTDKKDSHSSILVNRLTKFIKNLAKEAEIYILKGNHDYIDENNPFFGFLDYLDKVNYIKTITETETELFIPHSKSYDMIKTLDSNNYQVIFMHCDILGAQTSSNYRLEQGLDYNSDFFSKFTGSGIYSGHIHVPQVIGNITYIGSPYPVYFGDNFKGRALLLDENNKAEFLEIPSIRKYKIAIESIEDLKNYTFNENDQCKIKIQLDRNNLNKWELLATEVKKSLKEKGVDLTMIELEIKDTDIHILDNKQSENESDESIIKKFSNKEKLTLSYIEKGMEILYASDSKTDDSRL